MIFTRRCCTSFTCLCLSIATPLLAGEIIHIGGKSNPWNNMGFELDGTKRSTVSNILKGKIATETFTYQVTLTSLSEENLTMRQKFIGSGGRSFNAPGDGVRVEVKVLSGNVHFVGFDTVNHGKWASKSSFPNGHEIVSINNIHYSGAAKIDLVPEMFDQPPTTYELKILMSKKSGTSSTLDLGEMVLEFAVGKDQGDRSNQPSTLISVGGVSFILKGYE